MHDANEFLKALALVLCVAAVTTVLFQRLRQPVVLGYILAGLLVGPYLPVPLLADRGVVATLSELGVILLMFSLGIEFSLRRLAKVGPRAGLTALVQCSVLFWLGFVCGRAFGWTTREALFTGALICISSTTIIAKAFDEQGIKGRLRELVVGILVVEDLIAILLMAGLTAVAVEGNLSVGTLAKSAGRLAAFLLGLIVLGMLVVPRAVRLIVRLGRPETTLVASVGIGFASAYLALHFGYSVALGAFIAGSLIAESGEERAVEALVHPVRDMFAAIFFVSVGMLIDPKLIAEHWVAVTVLTSVVIVGKFLGVGVGAFLTGNGTRTSVQAAMSLAQIGEFSFIIAGLGRSLNATRPFLYPVAVAVSAVTTLTTPWLIRASGPVASFVDRKLPRPIQTFTSLYESWVTNLWSERTGAGAANHRRARLLFVDTLLLAAIVIGTSTYLDRLADFLAAFLGVTPQLGRILVVVSAVLLAMPFWYGIVRVAGRLAQALSRGVFPQKEGGVVDLAAAPRRVLMVTIQVTLILAIGLPLLALTQPFLRGPEGAIVLALLLCVFGGVFWRSATQLQGHVQAGTEVIVEALSAQARKGATGDDDAFRKVNALLPGLGAPTPFAVGGGCRAAGKTLAELNLRGVTGASVLAIVRGEDVVMVPRADELLRPGDVLALAGSDESVKAAKALLRGSSRD